MPRLNLKDDEFEGESDEGSEHQVAPPPTLREVGSGGGRSPLLLIIVIVVAIAAAVFALNYFKVIHLWGAKAPVVTESLPEPDLPMVDQSTQPLAGGETLPPPTEQAPSVAPTTVPEPETVPQVAPPEPSVKKPVKPTVSVPSAGHGNYTIQVSSWISREKADQEAAKLSSAGMEAFVDEGIVDGATWYRVRVGHYPTSAEAKEAAAQLQGTSESVVFVTKVGK